MDNQLAETEFVQKLTDLMAHGTEAETRQFILEHFKEFPAETQRGLALDIFEEALDEEIGKQESLLELRKGVADAISAEEINP
jgi:hypothetical protein